METHPLRVILASRSPRRLELLEHLVPRKRIEVIPPQDSTEAGFEALHDWPAISSRLQEIARTKCDDVRRQLERSGRDDFGVVIAADTIIVVNGPDGQLRVLGQPPEEEGLWQETVRGWFHDYYVGRTHAAVTGMCIASRERVAERVVRTQVTFHADSHKWLDWYLSTGEPRGKAGGYAIQGAASLFVSQVTGSISNVIGLPLHELLEVFEELEIDVLACPEA